MQKWVVTQKRADFSAIGIEFGIDPLIARVIRNRDIVGSENIKKYLHGTLSDIPSPWEMGGMEQAVLLLSGKIEEGKRIRVIGDYDIDGVTATYILTTGLARLGAVVDESIPDRIADGYGLSDQLIDRAVRDGIDTIVTCDNGIAASSQIDRAKTAGLTVLVTDHHEVPYEEEEGRKQYILPDADVILNPKQADCPYPNKNICGAVVAWKLIAALYEKAGIPEEEAWGFLEFLAIATIGDVMELQGENRILVREGLKVLPKTKNTGLKALIQATGLTGKNIGTYQIGFVLGPCINASGRLDTALRALALFKENDPEKAAALAGELHDLNESRKAMTEEGLNQALTILQEEGMVNTDRVLVVFLPECHESLAGIIAGRLRETYHRPSFVLTRSENGVKGSGRSIETYSMYEELTRCKDLLDQFGGHPMAAGLSLQEENVEALRKRLNANCTLNQDQLTEKIVIDAAISIAYISRKLVGQLAMLEPFGKGNEKPLFAQKDLHVVDCRVLGKNSNVLRMRVSDPAGFTMSAVYFGNAQKFYNDLKEKRRIAATYYPEINSYQGRESLQIVIQNYKVY